MDKRRALTSSGRAGKAVADGDKHVADAAGDQARPDPAHGPPAAHTDELAHLDQQPALSSETVELRKLRAKAVIDAQPARSKSAA